MKSKRLSASLQYLLPIFGTSSTSFQGLLQILNTPGLLRRSSGLKKRSFISFNKVNDSCVEPPSVLSLFSNINPTVNPSTEISFFFFYVHLVLHLVRSHPVCKKRRYLRIFYMGSFEKFIFFSYSPVHTYGR